MYRKIALCALCLTMLSATAAERYLSRREAIRAANDFRRQKRYVEAEHAFREAQRLSKSANDRKSARESANEMHNRARAHSRTISKIRLMNSKTFGATMIQAARPPAVIPPSCRAMNSPSP